MERSQLEEIKKMEYLLALSLAVIVFSRKVALALCAGALIVGVSQSIIEWPAILFLLVMAIIGRVCRLRFSDPRFKVPCEVLLVIGCWLLFKHWIPGFHNLLALDQVVAGPHSRPFTMYYNMDKALIPFLLVACVPTLFNAGAVKRVPVWRWLLLGGSVPGLLLCAVAIGGLAKEWHMPVWIGPFLLANLFFVSLAEEALFRAYIQRRLGQAIGGLPALFLTALLFGLVHYSGDWMLVVFAGLAGILYGLAWKWSGRLWVATFVHFALNVMHLLCFTYPSYRP